MAHKQATSYHLKIPADLMRQIKRFAAHDMRSVSSAVVFLIAAGLKAADDSVWEEKAKK